jgi:hypothetical protein
VTKYIRSDNKLMRLVPNILLIYQLQCGNLQTTSPVPAHIISSGAAIVFSIPRTQLVGCRLRLVFQPSRFLLLTHHGVLSLLILLFEIKRSSKIWDQVSKETAYFIKIRTVKIRLYLGAEMNFDS